MASLSRLGAGQTGKIKATVVTKGRSGNLNKGIKVATNDPKNPSMTLRMKAYVIGPPPPPPPPTPRPPSSGTSSELEKTAPAPAPAPAADDDDAIPAPAAPLAGDSK